MTIAIEEDGGIASLTRSVVDSNAADDPRRDRRFAAKARTRVGDTRRVKCTYTGYESETIAEIVGHDPGDDTPALITQESVTHRWTSDLIGERLPRRRPLAAPPIQN
jgi:hypothetical protein